MVRDVLDGHMLGQVQDIPDQRLGVAAPRLGKADVDLPHGLALAALHPRQIDDDPGQVDAEGNIAEPAGLAAAANHLPRTAGRTAAMLRLRLQEEQHHATAEFRLRQRVAADAAGVIQQTRGHADLSGLELLT